MDFSTIKSHFPIFANNPGLVYLDSSASAQKPQKMIAAVSDFYSKHYANIHRGLYPLSEQATEMYEQARATVARFLNANKQEIVFTAGTTDGLNLIARSLVESRIIPNQPKVLLSTLEHHSNILPWQQIGAQIDYMDVDDNYEFVLPQSLQGYDVVSLALVSNVTGTVLDVAELLKRMVDKKPLFILDAAQAVGHRLVDVQQLDCDILVFSAHKVYGPTGVGVMYAKSQLLERMEPLRAGGGMVSSVGRVSAEWKSGPEKFEAGTPPSAQAIGLAAAMDFLDEIGMENVYKHEQQVAAYAAAKLREISGLRLFHPQNTIAHAGVFSFTLESIHSHDLSDTLGTNGIALRAGNHCSQILHKEVLGVPATTRASLGIYNTKEDIDRLVLEIGHARNSFGV